MSRILFLLLLLLASPALAAYQPVPGTNGQFVYNSSGQWAAKTPVCGDLSNAGTACTAVAPADTSATANQWFTAYTAATGAFTKAQPAFSNLSGQATNAQLATQTANTLLGALTATTPSGQAVPSCSTTASALMWTTSTGFSCNTAIAAPAASITGTTIASGVTASSLTSFGNSPTIVTPSITTGFTIGGAATTGKFIIGNGTNYVPSTSTIPTSAGATANKVILSNGTDYVLSTPTFPNASATSLKHIRSDGTNWIASTATISDTPSTALKWLRSDGTNWITSTATLSDTPSTAGKIVVSDGTNWITSTPTFPNASATSGKTIRSDGTNWIASTATLSDAPSTALKWLRSDGTNWITSTSTLSDTPSTAGKIVVSDGTNWITSTPTFPNASATSGKAIISDGTNWVASTSLFGQVGGTYLGDAVTGNQTIVLVQYAPYAFTINTLKNLGTVAGTVTGDLKINGTNVTGCNTLSLTSTPAASTACSAANAVVAGDKITFVTTSASSLTGLLAFSMIGTRN